MKDDRMNPEQCWIATMLVLGGLLAECATEPKADPAAHWAMTEPAGTKSLADTSGHDRTATIEGGVRTGEGARANAASFPGEREALAMFEAPPLPALTLAAWVKVTGMGKGDKPYPRIIEWPGAFLHASRGRFGEMNLTFWAGKGHWSSSGRAGAFDQWTHVAVTFDCGDAVNVPVFYINGRRAPYAAGKQPAEAAVLRGGKGFLGNNGARNRPFEGLMSDVRMYDVILTPREIVALAPRTPDGHPPKDFVPVFRDELPLVDIQATRGQRE